MTKDLDSHVRSGGPSGDAHRYARISDVSLSLYTQWWQLETWLRELCHLELRAFGRQAKDAQFTHMAGPDNENPLAYLDFSQLTSLIESNWELFTHTLIEQSSWSGRRVELAQIRHRVGHVRRPHADDLGRMELTLRDLERGAFIAISEYNNRIQPSVEDADNAIIDGWIRGQHEVAQRLLEHAARQYETRLSLRRSIRPWSTSLEGPTPGLLWHADFTMGGKSLNVERFWDEVSSSRWGDLVVQADVDSYSLGLTFSGADDPSDVSDAIGDAFDMVLMSPSSMEPGEWRKRSAEYRELDYRIKVDTIWNILTDSTLPISVFGTGGQTKSKPRFRQVPR
jgi:hypothetical protein